jgi:multicomponent Na+:H+ antiporter subunit F
VSEPVLLAAIIAVLITMVLTLIRAFIGPTAYDRMLAANAFGTKTVLLIALGGHALSWHSYLDVALLYAMVNFVGTIAVMRFFEYGGGRSRNEEADPS